MLSLPPATKMFQFAGFARTGLCIQPAVFGLPHSDTSGSKLASSSPEHFVGNHVLHRLCVPRYPPLALISLTTFFLVLLVFCGLSNTLQNFLTFNLSELFTFRAVQFFLNSQFASALLLAFCFWLVLRISNKLILKSNLTLKVTLTLIDFYYAVFKVLFCLE